MASPLRTPARLLVAATAAALLLAAPPVGASAKSKRRDGWRMPHHFVDRTVFNNLLDDWLSSAATMALRDRVQLLPAVPDRYGLFFSKKAIDTRDFEVIFTISAVDKSEGKNELQDGALVFWLQPDNFASKYNEQTIVSHNSKDWYQGLVSAGLSLLGNRPNFEGLAMVFLNGKDKEKVVAGVWNDGKRSIDNVKDLAAQAAPEHKQIIEWMTAGTQVKVGVKPDGSITGSVMTLRIDQHLSGSRWGWAEDGVRSTMMLVFQGDGKLRADDAKHPNRGEEVGTWQTLSGSKVRINLKGQDYVLHFEGSYRAVCEEPARDPRPALLYGGKNLDPNHASDWQVVFRLPPGTWPERSSAFMGLTGWTGSKAYIEVDLHRLVTINFDTSTVGEDGSDLIKAGFDQWMKLLEEEKRYLSQASQADAVVRLTMLLGEHMRIYDSAGSQIQLDLAKLEARLDHLSSNMGNYLAATQSFSFDSKSFNPGEVLSHIVGIRSVLTKHKDQHDSQVAAVHKVAKDLRASGGGLNEGSKSQVNEVRKQTELMERASADGTTSLNIVFFVFIASIAGLGFLFFNRMRYYEKKHYI